MDKSFVVDFAMKNLLLTITTIINMVKLTLCKFHFS